MTRTTIDFGIDLGTTNSAVALLRGTAQEIIKNNLDHDITPSVVYINRTGQLQVGDRAKNQAPKHEDDVKFEFKRSMGTDHSHQFPASGRSMRADELSAEILKSLRGDVEQRLGEQISAAVITVPAAFEQRQCAATMKAAQLAGFRESPLILEPVAAALAYGFQAERERGYWLVFDFGGGTFDAAVLKADDGVVTVVNHGGDNFLGGSNIDWAIVDQLVAPRLAKQQPRLTRFTRDNPRWKTAFNKLKWAAEATKIDLSRRDTSPLLDCELEDDDGKKIEVEENLSREEVASVATPIIMRAIDIATRVLKEKQLATTAIEKLILVGGPTLAPYFRDLLHEKLRVPIDASVDPLTIVARGAAIFAGTQRLARDKSLPASRAGEFTIDLKYKPIDAEIDPLVAGQVNASNGTSIEGFTLEFINSSTQWRSGKIPLAINGTFKCNLLSQKGSQNIFEIELRNATGMKQPVAPDRVAYTVGLAPSEQPLVHSIGLALANNDSDIHFKKGDPLPAKCTRTYRSTKALSRGTSGEVLTIPIVEGENERADRNLLLGTLKIEAERVRRDLPSASEIQVTLHMNTSRQLWATAYVPLIDEEFKAEIRHNESEIQPDDLEREHREELARLEQLRLKAAETADSSAAQILTEVQASPIVQELSTGIQVAKTDHHAAQRCERGLLDLKVLLDKAEDALQWPTLVAEAKEWIGDLLKLVEQHGNDAQKQRAAQFSQEVEALITGRETDRLRKKISHIRDLYFQILYSLPGIWVGFFNNLLEEQPRMTDAVSAAKLINQGRLCIENNNLQGLKNVVWQLRDLLPTEVADRVQRGYGSSLIR